MEDELDIKQALEYLLQLVDIFIGFVSTQNWKKMGRRRKMDSCVEVVVVVVTYLVTQLSYQ